MCARREEEESHEADRWGHARKEKGTVRSGGLDRGEKKKREIGPAREKEKAQVWPAGSGFFKKKNAANGKDFWTDFGRKEKHIKICAWLRGIFLILQNWFEPI